MKPTENSACKKASVIPAEMEPTNSVICWDGTIGEFVYVGCEGRKPNPALLPCILRDALVDKGRGWVQVANVRD